MDSSDALEERFLELLEKHKRLLFKVATVYVNDEQRRKDLIQEIILQLWKAFPDYDDSYAESTWIYRIALNVSISSLRKTSARKKHIQHYQHMLTYEHEENTEYTDQLQQLYKMIKNLPAMDRALVLLYLDGKKHKEIAEIIGISSSNVGSRISRIKQAFVKQIQSPQIK